MNIYQDYNYPDQAIEYHLQASPIFGVDFYQTGFEQKHYIFLVPKNNRYPEKQELHALQ